MGVAVQQGEQTWAISEDMEKVLRAAQKTKDVQKTLNQHGVTASDDRPPLQVLNMRTIKTVEGRDHALHGE